MSAPLPPGHQPPRVEVYPDYVTSAGDEAAELAASAGLVLDPWQRRVLTHMLGERRDGKWAAFECGLIVSRQNGKGSVLEALELAKLLLFGSKLIMHTAHELKTAMEHMRRMVALFEASDDLRRLVKKVIVANGSEGIEFRNGGRLRFVARSKGSGRGFTGDDIILDEAYALTSEQVGALMPTLSARPNPQVVYTSSPPLDAVTGAQLFAVRKRALSDTPGRLAWFDYGIAGQLDRLDLINLDDRALWRQANPAVDIRIFEEFIESERAAMDDESFARERLGVWPADLGENFGVIPEEAWSAALDEQSKIVGKFVIAVAVSVDRSRATIAAAGKRADGNLHVEITSTLTQTDNQPGTGWLLPRLAELRARHGRRIAAIVMDKFGATGSVHDQATEAGFEIIGMGTSDVARAYGMFYDGICGDEQARTTRHIGQPELTSAVAGATTRPLGDGTAWDRRNALVDITPVVAATHALWGFVVHGNPPEAPPWFSYG